MNGLWASVVANAPYLLAIAVAGVVGAAAAWFKHWLDEQLRRPYWQIVATSRATGVQVILPLRYGSKSRAERARVVADSLHRSTHTYTLLRHGGAR